MDYSSVMRRAELVEAVAELEGAAATFAHFVARHCQASWFWHDPAEPPPDKSDIGSERLRRRPLERACELIRAIEYVDGQDEKTTRKQPGLLALPERGIELAHALNAVKLRVKRAWTALEKDTIEVRDPDTGQLIERPLREVALEGCRHARLHQRQAIRALVVFEEPPEQVSFSWAYVTAITQTDCAAVRKILMELRAQGMHAAMDDLKRLDGMRDDEPLARLRATNLQARANVSWRMADGSVRRRVVRAAMPLVIQGATLPNFRALPAEPHQPAVRTKRADVQIASEPLLSCLRIHRYLDPEDARRRRQAAGCRTIALAPE